VGTDIPVYLRRKEGLLSGVGFPRNFEQEPQGFVKLKYSFLSKKGWESWSWKRSFVRLIATPITTTGYLPNLRQLLLLLFFFSRLLVHLLILIIIMITFTIAVTTSFLAKK
jgi:hypothetical protein